MIFKSLKKINLIFKYKKQYKNKMSLLINNTEDIFSKYETKETIGRGTFGKVKLGINIKTKEKVAIKILEKRKIKNKDDSERVEREIEILKNTNNINIIKTNEIIETKENYYLIMEYCEKGELFNYIVKKQRLNDKESSYFYYQLIKGLQYIHSKKIVHRDLKPENLLLDKNNILKIIDFGLSNYFNNEINLLKTPVEVLVMLLQKWFLVKNIMVFLLIFGVVVLFYML